ncbi:PAS domain-containing protein [Aeromicrobium tamlense]|uniref:histidine kinase n=1 Tax=Aeromicrobium tamlense TaxID=375541 RepID=A0A8I0FU84_9ACTN|nr:PAS domain-containing sensor histidine kinase [Aeromicrobium tamlense]MBD1270647.1 PAS domain-containing protein [Aeromicrobium tamlense]MBD1271221.1 PAS domain-containing protein [Aeromicrobium tamlense]NYI38036.1 signal transduction histidine kinase [Aeromicrobium tamlense]
MPFEEFPDGIIVADADARVTLANRWVRYWARAVGDEMLGMHLRDAVPFDDLAGNSWFDSVQPYDGLAIRSRISESSWYSPRGSEYLITASLVRERPAGKVVKVIVSMRNARVRLQRDREKSDMVATVAHELRSPLTGIKGFSATLLSRWDAFTEEQRLFMLQTIDADADRLSRLITELLDAARIDAGRLSLRTEPVRLDELADRVLGSVFSASETAPTARVDGEAPVVWGDADRVTQVLTNLIENAIRHGEGLREVVVSSEKRGELEGVAVRIVDNGQGIPEESRVRIFSRFWRSGPGAGSGLGMFIVRGVVDQHGGSIVIEDAEGGGASICVWFPINEPDTLTS